MKKFFNLLIVLFAAVFFSGFSSFALAQSESDGIVVTAWVDQLGDDNNPKGYSVAVNVVNHTNTTLEANQWRLHFTFPRFIASASSQQEAPAFLDVCDKNEKDPTNCHTGDAYTVTGTETVAPGQMVTITINSTEDWAIKKLTDAPRGYFVSFNGVAMPTTYSTNLPTWPAAGVQGVDDYTTNQNYDLNGGNIDLASRKIGILPKPVDVSLGQGQFVLTPQSKIYYENNDAKRAAQYLASVLLDKTGNQIQVVALQRSTVNGIVLAVDKPKGQQSSLPGEGYRLSVSPSGVVIKANDYAGWFYGVQSFRQLLPSKLSSSRVINIPAVDVLDYPRYKYRGMELDAARHFIPYPLVKRFVDLMAMYKLNTFHWHLSDDEGWRIEIEKYSALNQIGSKRGFPFYDVTGNRIQLEPAQGSEAQSYPNFPGQPQQGYYTRSQIRDLVAYAKERNITIIPEVDMPGHARALVKSLPDLLVDPDDQSVYQSVQGFNDNLLSPCLDSTFEVIHNILAEIAPLFPGKRLHIGSDEVPAGAWLGSPSCQSLMSTLGIDPGDDGADAKLQNYFNQKVADIVKSLGKSAAGWQEVINGGTVPSDTLVDIWNTLTDEQKEALKENQYPVVLTPASNLYFDLSYNKDPVEPGYYWAGYVDTFRAYAFDPDQFERENGLSSDQVLGVQGALWSENVTGEDPYNFDELANRMDYLTFPKLLGLAELAWTPESERDWNDFAYRVGHFALPALDAMKVEYRVPMPGISPDGRLANIVFPGLTIRYTLDGSEPTSFSPEYTGMLPSVNSELVRMRTFTTTDRMSRVSTVANN